LLHAQGRQARSTWIRIHGRFFGTAGRLFPIGTDHFSWLTDYDHMLHGRAMPSVHALEQVSRTLRFLISGIVEFSSFPVGFRYLYSVPVLLLKCKMSRRDAHGTFLYILYWFSEFAVQPVARLKTNIIK